MRCKSLRSIVVVIGILGFAHMAAGQVRPGQSYDPVAPGLKVYTSAYYTIHTDLPEDDAKEATLRMTRMFDEYHRRTAGLFQGQVNQRLAFYLFGNEEEYLRAGGLPRTAGVFDGTKLMAVAVQNPEEHGISALTWHVVQHEGFHQFVAAVIRGQIPIWVNEGMAEYFGEGMFTGDDMVVGLVPTQRMQRVQKMIRDGKSKTVREMMYMSHEEWNGQMQLTNYDQAWSMVHFLATAEDGKYQDAFTKFLQLVGRAWPWENAWKASFGSAEGFEEKWKAYWLGLHDHPTLDLYAKVDVSILTSFLGRAASQRQSFDDFAEFLKTDATAMKYTPADWLPPRLFEQGKDLSAQLQDVGGKFFLRYPEHGKLPELVCELGDGTRVIGTFDLAYSRVGHVRADIKKAPGTGASAPKN